MRRLDIKVSIFIILLIFANVTIEPVFAKIFSHNKSATINYFDYFETKKTKFDTVKFDKNRNLTFRNKLIVSDGATPLNEKNNFNSLTITSFFIAQGLRPKMVCDEKHVLKNGYLWCYKNGKVKHNLQNKLLETVLIYPDVPFEIVKIAREKGYGDYNIRYGKSSLIHNNQINFYRLWKINPDGMPSENILIISKENAIIMPLHDYVLKYSQN